MPMESSEGESSATTKPRKARALQGTRQLAMSDLAEDTGFKIVFRIWQHDGEFWWRGKDRSQILLEEALEEVRRKSELMRVMTE